MSKGGRESREGDAPKGWRAEGWVVGLAKGVGNELGQLWVKYGSWKREAVS